MLYDLAFLLLGLELGAPPTHTICCVLTTWYGWLHSSPGSVVAGPVVVKLKWSQQRSNDRDPSRSASAAFPSLSHGKRIACNTQTEGSVSSHDCVRPHSRLMLAVPPVFKPWLKRIGRKQRLCSLPPDCLAGCACAGTTATHVALHRSVCSPCLSRRTDSPPLQPWWLCRQVSTNGMAQA